MSFSAQVKQEISDNLPVARHCRIAFLSGLFLACDFFVQNDGTVGGEKIIFRTENLSAMRICFTLLQKTFNIKDGLSEKSLEISGSEAEKVAGALKLKETPEGVNTLLIERECCKRSFLQAVFLSAGSLTDPARSYHLEIVCKTELAAEALREIGDAFGIHARVIRRKKAWVFYIKEGDEIVNLLGVLGAHKSLMAMENTRILHDMRGNVNRRVNCETANIAKTVDAAVRQSADIELIIRAGEFQNLSPPLKEAAELRLSHKDATLTELGKLLEPPVGKSGMNHRFRKLSGIAEKLRQSGASCPE
ncbi:MAG: DNA-binding protein WhiA [Lachnospiraceae bacterium]|nr:DNA-binding protein WhiA [Lachnospiraceae bacterium]